MKILVTLKGKFQDKLSIEEVVKVGKMTNVNWDLALEFGIVSGEAPPGVEDDIRALNQVETVEPVGTKNINPKP